MLSQIQTAILYVLFSFSVLAAAIPGGTPTTISITNMPPVTTTVTVTEQPTSTSIPASQCDTGSIQCCDATTSATSFAGSALLGLLGIIISDLNVILGVVCSPISIIGAGGSSCAAEPVCCENNNFNGLIAIGCTPININL